MLSKFLTNSSVTANNKFFISNSFHDNEIVNAKILPILLELGLKEWSDIPRSEKKYSFYDNIYDGISNSDFIIAVFTSDHKYPNFEVGVAIGQGKPVICITMGDIDTYWLDERSLPYLVYQDSNIDGFKFYLLRKLEALSENIINAQDFELVKDRKLIGIRVGEQNNDIERGLRVTADLLEILKEICDTDDIKLVKTSKGSFKTLFSIDLKAWAKLIEKLAFFWPELKRRNAENRRIDAKTRKELADAAGKEIDNNIKQVNAFLDTFERAKGLGITVQLDSDVILTNDNNLIEFKKPMPIENE